MKRWKSLTAALCAAVLLCGFSVPSYAYADGGAGSDYGDPTMETPAPAPEPTIEPGQGFSEEGGFVTRDLLYDENTNKQFITVHTSGGATFYFVIGYDVCSVNMGKCVGAAPEPVETEEPAEEPETGGSMGTLLLILAVAGIGGGAAFYFKVLRPKQQQAAEPEEDYGEEDYEDDGPPWDEDENSEEDEE